jgi:hypothetical protein
MEETDRHRQICTAHRSAGCMPRTQATTAAPVQSNSIQRRLTSNLGLSSAARRSGGFFSFDMLHAFKIHHDTLTNSIMRHVAMLIGSPCGVLEGSSKYSPCHKVIYGLVILVDAVGKHPCHGVKMLGQFGQIYLQHEFDLAFVHDV